MKAPLIEAEDGDQIVVFPPGFEMTTDIVEMTRDGQRVILSPVVAEDLTDLES